MPEQSWVICPVCDHKMPTKPILKGTNAHCPVCDTELYRSKDTLLATNLMLAITGLFFFLPAIYFPFISIRLINVNFSSTVTTGAISLFTEGFWTLGVLIFICSTIFPIALFASVITAHIGMHIKHFNLFKYSLVTYQHLKHWWMVDVFLLGVAVAAFKLQEYSTVTPKAGLICLAFCQVVAISLMVRMSVRRYWKAWQPASEFNFEDVDVHCHHCHLCQPETNQCVRCHSEIKKPDFSSIQKTWIFLSCATVFLLPANYLDISIIFSNGVRYVDTIFSGVVQLTQGHIPIAIIIFVASILVPIAKIVGLAYILICIQLKSVEEQYQRMKLYLFVKWIGKWSILDLYVIASTIALVDRDQILDFTPGPAAIAFAAVVVLTMFAAESLDPRLIWSAGKKPIIQTPTNSDKTPPMTDSLIAPSFDAHYFGADINKPSNRIENPSS
ncbi:MAG: PqiA/YebS family transporter subunit [Vibrio sp.]